MKYAIVDVETTGLNPYRNTIWSLSVTIFDGEGEDYLSYECAPVKGSTIDSKSLSMAGKVEADIIGLEAPDIVWDRFQHDLRKYIDPYNRKDKLHFIGYNARFDYDFVRNWWKQFDKYFGSFFWFPPIDVMNLAATFFMPARKTIPDFKLATVAAALEIPVEQDRLHTSEYDRDLTLIIFKLLYKHMNHAKGDDDGDKDSSTKVEKKSRASNSTAATVSREVQLKGKRSVNEKPDSRDSIKQE